MISRRPAAGNRGKTQTRRARDTFLIGVAFHGFFVDLRSRSGTLSGRGAERYRVVDERNAVRRGPRAIRATHGSRGSPGITAPGSLAKWKVNVRKNFEPLPAVPASPLSRKVSRDRWGNLYFAFPAHVFPLHRRLRGSFIAREYTPYDGIKISLGIQRNLRSETPLPPRRRGNAGTGSTETVTRARRIFPRSAKEIRRAVSRARKYYSSYAAATRPAVISRLVRN